MTIAQTPYLSDGRGFLVTTWISNQERMHLTVLWRLNTRLAIRTVTRRLPLWLGSKKMSSQKIESTDLSHDENIAILKKTDPHTGEKRMGRNFNYPMELGALASRLGYTTDQLPSLSTALIHRSALSQLNSNEQPEDYHSRHNSRLSTVGYSTLVHYVHEFLYQTYPNMEGYMLWDISNYLTKWSTLEKICQHLGATDLIVSQVTLNTQIIGKAFRAILGAVFIDQGSKAARDLIHNYIIPQLRETDLHDLIKLQHPKFMLKALLKAQGKEAPQSRLLWETGRNTHFPTFVVGVYSGSQYLAEGAGSSLRRAEEEAASAAIRNHFMGEVKTSPLPSAYSEYRSESKLNFKQIKTDLEARNSQTE